MFLRPWKGVGQLWRLLSTEASQLQYHEHGDPCSVLTLKQVSLGSPGEHELLVEMLMAPVNPADLNMIQGIYPIKPPLPAVGGNEGVGRVAMIGSGVKAFSVGDVVVRSGQGTWTTHAIVKEDQLYKVNPSLAATVDPAVLSTLTVNFCTAFRMLNDFVKLERGDVVVQNGANSAVGQAVIQIADCMGLKSVNIIRDKLDVQTTIDYLSSLGADIIVIEEQLKGMNGKALFKEIPPPKLALNCVGGRSSMYLASFLAVGGKMVTYGGMSRMPVQAPTAPFIFKNISLHGFWMSRWYTENAANVQQVSEMFVNLLTLASQGKLKPPLHEKVNFIDDWKKAVEIAASGSGKKQLFLFKND